MLLLTCLYKKEYGKALVTYLFLLIDNLPLYPYSIASAPFCASLLSTFFWLSLISKNSLQNRLN